MGIDYDSASEKLMSDNQTFVLFASLMDGWLN